MCDFVMCILSPPVVSRLASGAAVDRYERERQQHTSVINLLDVRNERRMEGDSTGVVRPTVAEEDDDEYYDYYYEDEDEDDLSGDYEVEVPRGKSSVLAIQFHWHLCYNTVIINMSYDVVMITYQLFDICNPCYLKNTRELIFTLHLFSSFSCYVKPTQGPVSHSERREGRGEEEEGEGKEEGKRQGKEEESMFEEV